MKIFLSHLEDYPNDLRLKCFEVFYWFSRFEFALKENGYLKEGPYSAALPDWEHPGTSIRRNMFYLRKRNAFFMHHPRDKSSAMAATSGKERT